MSLGFEFATATRIIFGAGRVKEAGSIAGSLGKQALVVTGRNASRAEPLIVSLQAAGVGSSVFTTSGEPSIETVTEGLLAGRQGRCDLVVSFGGGSAIDAGKAIAAMLTNEGELLDYLEVIGRGKALEKPAAPFVAIPTTAGTGSEVTRNAVLSSAQHGVKVSLRSPLMLARVALVDSQLTHGLPAGITASTGLDALTQLVEPYVCNRTNPMTDAVCLQGLERAARALPMVCANGRDAGAREDMALASLFGGLALANAGLGAVHGFAGPIGGMFPAPHGSICAALLPHVMAINLQALRAREPASDSIKRYETVGRILTGRPDARGEDGVAWVGRLIQNLQIPGLAAYGIDSRALEELADKSAKASSMKANPIALTRQELIHVLHQAL